MILGTVLFWCVFVLGVFVGTQLRSSAKMKQIKNKVAGVLERKPKADILHTKTEVEEALVDKHRREAENGVEFDI